MKNKKSYLLDDIDMNILERDPPPHYYNNRHY